MRRVQVGILWSYASDSSLSDELSASAASGLAATLTFLRSRGFGARGSGRGRLPRRVPGGRSQPTLKYLNESLAFSSSRTRGSDTGPAGSTSGAA